MTLTDIAINTIDDKPTNLGAFAGQVVLLVNVASKCGLTPQYEGLERVHERYADRGFTVVGVPSNDFMGQEPGSAEEIVEFCSSTYGVTFPLLEKTVVKGDGQHPLYAELTKVEDGEGVAGDVQWNFEKFLIGADGTVLQRIRPKTVPEDPAVIAAIEAALAG